MKKIISSVGMLGLAAALFGTSTYAWFSMNREVSAEGMKVKAKVDASLVITYGSMPTTSTTTVTASASDSTANELLNSTHYNSDMLGKTGDTADAKKKCLKDEMDKTPTGLVKLNNAGSADKTTGIVASPIYEATTNTNVGGVAYDYFVDYVFYVASIGAGMSDQYLKVSMDFDNTTLKITDITNNINGAVSADIYYLEGQTKAITDNNVFTTQKNPTNETKLDYADVNYIGTLNLAGLDPEVNDALTAQDAVYSTDKVVVPGLDEETSGKKAVAILCRVYVDGNLNKSYDKTKSKATGKFINTNDQANVKELDITFKFEWVDELPSAE